jgi:TonB family protein
MKFCPVCRKQYPADLSFCLDDGTPLVSDTASATNAVTEEYRADGTQLTRQNPTAAEARSTKIRPTPRPAKSRTFTYVIAIGLFLIAGLVLLGAGIGGLWYYRSLREDRTATVPYPSNTKNGSTSNGPNSSPAPPPLNSNSRKANTYASNNVRPSVKIEPNQVNTSAPVETEPDGKRPVPKQIPGGVLNGKATSLPKPPYPPAARAVGASGSVSVQVLVDENGNVVSANAVTGHPLLRAAAVSAARSARFSPTVLSGQPVKVSGIITYNFVP